MIVTVVPQTVGHDDGNRRLSSRSIHLAFESARDAGHELSECIRAVLKVAAPQDVSGPGMSIVSFVEPDPGEAGPEVSL